MSLQKMSTSAAISIYSLDCLLDLYYFSLDCLFGVFLGAVESEKHFLDPNTCCLLSVRDM